MASELTGVGLYTLPDAASLLHTESREIKRWLFGYSFKSSTGTKHSSQALWRPQVNDLDIPAIGFKDLMELRFVKEFMRKGVSLQVVRAALESARAIFGMDYPFSNRRFLTDGRSIYTSALASQPRDGLLDLAKRQLAFDHVIRPSLNDGVEFAPDGAVKRWYPLPKSRTVVLDPEISFGRPSIDTFGVPTAALAGAISSGQSKAAVARMYEVPVSAVDAALRFERRLAS